MPSTVPCLVAVRGEHRQRSVGGEDTDVAEGAEDGQILIAGKDRVARAASAVASNDIIVWIAADGRR